MRQALGISVAFHAAAAAALLLLARALSPPLLVPPTPKAFEIALDAPAVPIETVRPVAPSEPVVEPIRPIPPARQTPPPEQAVAPAQPERRIIAVEPPPPHPVPRPARPRVRPRQQEADLPPPEPAYEPRAYEPIPSPSAPPDYEAAPPAPAPRAYAPAPPAAAPRPDLEAGYRAALSRWFESHKRYPESARERDEEGRAVVRFRVDSSGRVLSFALEQSTGYPDLDRSISEMLDGAQLPPFPPGLALSSLEVAVTLRFSLQ